MTAASVFTITNMVPIRANRVSSNGSIIYKACVAVAIRNFEPQAMKLITAILFLVVLVISMGGKKKVKGNA